MPVPRVGGYYARDNLIKEMICPLLAHAHVFPHALPYLSLLLLAMGRHI